MFRIREKFELQKSIYENVFKGNKFDDESNCDRTKCRIRERLDYYENVSLKGLLNNRYYILLICCIFFIHLERRKRLSLSSCIYSIPPLNGTVNLTEVPPIKLWTKEFCRTNNSRF